MTHEEQIQILEQIETTVSAALAVLPYAKIVDGQPGFTVAFTTTDIVIHERPDPKQWEVQREPGGILRVFNNPKDAAEFAVLQIVRRRLADHAGKAWVEE